MLYPVILCGGSGTRLWPLSREMYPKQFVDLGEGRTLFKDTLRRASLIPDIADIMIVCNEAHRFYASTSLLECALQAQLILEPEARNTAPAIALAAFSIYDKDPDGILLVMPSDHMLKDEKIFVEAVQKATNLAEKGRIVTFGITPNSPETGYGYIQQGDSLPNGGYKVVQFVEKPDHVKAVSMLKEGGYLWNSGMFLVAASTYLEELRAFAPEIYTQCQKAWSERCKDGAFLRPERNAFLSSPSNSIDYAIMEHTTHAVVYPLDLKWNDLGSWEAFYQTGEKDSSANVCRGDIVTKNVHNSYLLGTNRLIVALDVDNISVIETRDAILVASRNSVQQVKDIVSRLKSENRIEYQYHPLVYRPWGSYECLAKGSRFQVKRIVVNPGEQLSLQMHYHRAEHWVIVSGTAEITNGNTVKIFAENQSTYIPLGTVHRLKNPGHIPLIIIEIQSGAYLEEDDILRLEDEYGRMTKVNEEIN